MDAFDSIIRLAAEDLIAIFKLYGGLQGRCVYIVIQCLLREAKSQRAFGKHVIDGEGDRRRDGLIGPLDQDVYIPPLIGLLGGQIATGVEQFRTAVQPQYTGQVVRGSAVRATVADFDEGIDEPGFP